jgi:hypothetical protein
MGKIFGNKMKKTITIFLLLMSVMGFSQTKITAVKVGDRIDVTINKFFFTSYLFAKNEKYPFFYPVNGPSGAGVTSMRNGIWPHHSSLFFGSDDVNGGNYWNKALSGGQIVSTREEIIENNGPRLVIENDCIWKRPDAPAPIQDFRKITITAPTKDIFQIDFEVTMEMLMDVSIAKTNHSLFSGRMDPSLSVDFGGTMIDADGAQGEKGTYGKPSPWIDCYGKRGDKIEGMAIMQHPSNNWYPAPWFTRDYGFFSPTPLNWPKDDKETLFKKGEKIHLKYRVLVHSGTHETANIAGEFKKFAAEK